METGETLHLILMIVLTPISFGAFLAVMVWFIRQRTEDNSSRRVDDIWARRQQWGEGVCRQLINQHIEPGMSEEMVTLAWGQPSQVVKTTTGEETWRYQTSQVVFKEGLVDSVSGQPPQTGGLNPWLLIAIIFGIAIMVSIITLIVIFTV